MEEKIYKIAHVYKIVDNTNGNIYIGSTSKSLEERLDSHERVYRHYVKTGNQRKYYTSFDIIKNEDYNILLIETYKNISKKDLRKMEGYFTKNVKCINIQIEGRNKGDWYKENKDECNRKSKEDYQQNSERYKSLAKKYRDENKEEIKRKRSEKINCECGGVYSKQTKARHFKSNKHEQYFNTIL